MDNLECSRCGHADPASSYEECHICGAVMCEGCADFCDCGNVVCRDCHLSCDSCGCIICSDCDVGSDLCELCAVYQEGDKEHPDDFAEDEPGEV